MDYDCVRRDEGRDAGVPARIVARRAPGGMLIEVAGHDFVAYRACAVGCRPEPQYLFLAGLVMCASLGLESSMRRHGFPVDQLRLEAQVERMADGRRCVTLRPTLPSAVSADDREAIRREILASCVRYAPTRSDMHLEICVDGTEKTSSGAGILTDREEAMSS